MSIFVSMLSNAKHPAFKLYTNTEQAVVTGYTKKANNLVTSYAANRDTSLWPFLFQIASESAAGNQIYSTVKQQQADLMWSECCNIIISWDMMSVCSQWHFCFLQLINCSSLIIRQTKTGGYFWLVLEHIHPCTLGSPVFFLHLSTASSLLWAYVLNFLGEGTSILFGTSNFYHNINELWLKIHAMKCWITFCGTLYDISTNLQNRLKRVQFLGSNERFWFGQPKTKYSLPRFQHLVTKRGKFNSSEDAELWLWTAKQRQQLILLKHYQVSAWKF